LIERVVQKFRELVKNKIEIFKKSVVLVDSRTLSQPIGSGLTQGARSSPAPEGFVMAAAASLY
jgi:hypothetical protein